jgi:CheY-like chemotaxis protein
MADKLILIVEDNEKNRKLVRDVLQYSGYDTVESDTAEEGIQLAKEQRPDLILMDITLPGMNGIAALRHLRADADTARIPVVAVTASAMSHDQQKIMDAGFDGYLMKPIDIKEFLNEVRGVLESPPDKGAAV